MSRQCPACGRIVSIWRWSGRAPVVRYYPKPGASWFRFTPEHLYCRNCGVEIRFALLPLGYFLCAVGAGLLGALAAVFALSQRLLIVAAPYSHYLPFWWVVSWLLICLIGGRWGMRITLVRDNGGSSRDAL
jgi:hypothetical protein